jgi:hypothetical protein
LVVELAIEELFGDRKVSTKLELRTVLVMAELVRFGDTIDAAEWSISTLGLKIGTLSEL